MGIGSPVPYEEMKQRTKADEKSLKNGINFAFGGTGVFTTIFILPNMTTQIDFFQELIEENVYTKHDLNSSIALVSLAGNDYTTYMAHNGTQQGLPAFTKSVIKQLSVDLMRIHDLGVRNIGVTAMEPLGCLPTSTAFSSYKKCNQTDNTATKFHNHILQQAVQKLRNQNKDSNIVILDLYSAFMSVLKEQKNHPGTRKFVHPLRPCCLGVSEEYSCGSVSNTGAKKYVVCDNPKLSFFWDHVHPSHQGWHAIYSALGPCLYQLY
ncbi:hypothetical protein RJ639_008974 [Escallonia herrerae]|uniref:GDSL esterase/lipase n=1 Tax=Escallonia herrerae TaxID=1293975 RepID=A0AA88VSN6_9ASTE|nr:hypothetical protein RJ639_008974 [Escallonia herrerae]